MPATAGATIWENDYAVSRRETLDRVGNIVSECHLRVLLVTVVSRHEETRVLDTACNVVRNSNSIARVSTHRANGKATFNVDHILASKGRSTLHMANDVLVNRDLVTGRDADTDWPEVEERVASQDDVL